MVLLAMTLIGCKGADEKPADESAAAADPALVAEDHPVFSVLEPAKVDAMGSVSSLWSAAVSDLLGKANGALTSGEANEHGNFATTIVAGQTTIETDDGAFSDVSFAIFTPTADFAADAEASAALSGLSAAELYQDGDVNVDLESLTGYTGDWVMVGSATGESAEGGLTGVSASLMAHQAEEEGADPTTALETEAHAYYIASAELLILDVFGTDVGYSNESFEGVAAEDSQVTAQFDFAAEMLRLTTEDVSVPSSIALE